MEERIEKLKKQYRDAQRGTILGLIFIVLMVAFILEVNFAQAFFGERTINKWTLNLIAGTVFLCLLIFREKKNLPLLSRVQYTGLITLAAGIFWYWALAISNRIGQGHLPTYVRQVTFDRTLITSQKSKEAPNQRILQYRHEVLDDAGRRTYFTAPIDLLPGAEQGEQVTVTITKGRLGQDFIVYRP